MKIELVVTNPVELSIPVGEDDIKALREAGIETDEKSENFDADACTSWLVKYWCSEASDWAIHDLMRDHESARDAPDPSQCWVNGVYGEDGWSL